MRKEASGLRKAINLFLNEFLDKKVDRYQIINPREVVVGEWVRLKCQYGCVMVMLSVLPVFLILPGLKKTSRILEDFSLPCFCGKPEGYQDLRRICTDLERALFLEGYYKAFAMPSGPCELCGRYPCKYPCRYPERTRPSMEACGIGVYATVRKFGFPVEVVRFRNCKANCYALCLIE